DRIRLSSYTFDEIWEWIRHNLPDLVRLFNKEVLGDHFSTLGPHLELWSALADEASRQEEPRLSELAAAIKSKAEASRRMAAAALPAEAKKKPPGLRVACAGRRLEGRQKEFAAALTALAGEYGVGGRVLSGAEDSAAGLAELLPLASPF